MSEEGNDAILSLHDAYALGERIVESADRLAKVDPAVPGTQAKWSFDMDGVTFDVVITKRRGDAP